MLKQKRPLEMVVLMTTVVTGAYDGAEVCELIGIYMLCLVGKKYVQKY